MLRPVQSERCLVNRVLVLRPEMHRKRGRALSDGVKSSTPQRLPHIYDHHSVVQLQHSYGTEDKTAPVKSIELTTDRHRPQLSADDSTLTETAASQVDHSAGYTYSRSHAGTRGQSLLSQTWKSGLHHLPALTFVSSMRSAYSIIDRHAVAEESDLTETEALLGTAESDEYEGARNVLPAVVESAEQRQWSTYDNACRTASVWVSGWNVINLIQGVGVLAVPYACVQAGWLCLPVLILLAVITCYTGHMVGECLYDSPRLTVTGYRELYRTRVRSTLACIAADALPYVGQRLTSAIVILDMFGAAILYLLLLGKSLARLLGPLFRVNWPLGNWILMGGCLQVPVILCPGMHIVAWFSMIAMVGLHSCILIGIVYCAQEIKQSLVQGLYLPPPNMQTLPVAISIIVFSYTAHAALPGIEGSMKQPGYYPKMLNVAFSIAGIVKLTFGLFCAIVIGAGIKDSVTDSMSHRPHFDLIMNGFVAISVFFSNPLFFHILGEQLDSTVAPYVRRGFLSKRSLCSLYTSWFVSTRCSLLALALLIAVVVPFFTTIIGFLGAVSCCSLAFILPCTFHLILFWSRLSVCAKVTRVLIALLGVLASVLGLISATWKIKNGS